MFCDRGLLLCTLVPVIHPADTARTLVCQASVLPHGRAGKLAGLAVTSARCSPMAPDLPTLGEAGIAGFEASSGPPAVVGRGTSTAAPGWSCPGPQARQ